MKSSIRELRAALAEIHEITTDTDAFFRRSGYEIDPLFKCSSHLFALGYIGEMARRLSGKPLPRCICADAEKANG